MAIQTLITAIQTLAGAITGVRVAPSAPLGVLTVFPALMCYASEGNITSEDFGEKTAHHTINLEVHFAVDGDFTRAVSTATPWIDSVPNALYADDHLQASGYQIENISYQFGMLGWGATNTIGPRFQIRVWGYSSL